MIQVSGISLACGVLSGCEIPGSLPVRVDICSGNLYSKFKVHSTVPLINNAGNTKLFRGNNKVCGRFEGSKLASMNCSHLSGRQEYAKNIAQLVDTVAATAGVCLMMRNICPTRILIPRSWIQV
jgi:hypothetical protein